MFDGLPFDAGPLAQDVGGSAEVGVRRRHVLQALVVSGMVVVLDEGADLGLQCPPSAPIVRRQKF